MDYTPGQIVPESGTKIRIRFNNGVPWVKGILYPSSITTGCSHSEIFLVNKSLLA